MKQPLFFGNGDIRSKLNTRIIGQRVYIHDVVESTNDLARALADKGIPEGTVVLAAGQTKGRGRMGRAWVSPVNGGIYASVVLRPRWDPERIALLTLTVALAIVRSVEGSYASGAVIKWPNDIYLDGHKLGGILTEAYEAADGQMVVIVGLGINVNAPRALLPPEAIALRREHSEEIDTADFTHILLKRLDEEYARFLDGDFRGILEDVRAVSALRLGQRVRIDQDGRVLEGFVQDLDESGALVLRLDSGVLKLVTAGRLTV